MNRVTAQHSFPEFLHILYIWREKIVLNQLKCDVLQFQFWRQPVIIRVSGRFVCFLCVCVCLCMSVFNDTREQFERIRGYLTVFSRISAYFRVFQYISAY